MVIRPGDEIHLQKQTISEKQRIIHLALTNFTKEANKKQYETLLHQINNS